MQMDVDELQRKIKARGLKKMASAPSDIMSILFVQILIQTQTVSRGKLVFTGRKERCGLKPKETNRMNPDISILRVSPILSCVMVIHN